MPFSEWKRNVDQLMCFYFCKFSDRQDDDRGLKSHSEIMAIPKLLREDSNRFQALIFTLRHKSIHLWCYIVPLNTAHICFLIPFFGF